MGAKKGGVKILCVAAELKNRGQKSICGHKKGGSIFYVSLKKGVKILCSKSWEGQNSMKAKIWGSKFYFFLVEPLVKILCSLKRGVKILYFSQCLEKGGSKPRSLPTNFTEGVPPPGLYHGAFPGIGSWLVVKQWKCVMHLMFPWVIKTSNNLKQA